MKKIITLLVVLAATLTVQAQEHVFQTIYNMAQKTAYDPQASDAERNIARFRMDAVTYLNTQTLSLLTDTARAVSDEESAHLIQQLDSMAYFMYDYIDVFLKEYRRVKSNKDKDRVLKIFRDASLQNPLFNDPDIEIVWAYSNSEDVLTRFSLDTNWVKALAAARRKLQE